MENLLALSSQASISILNEFSNIPFEELLNWRLYVSSRGLYFYWERDCWGKINTQTLPLSGLSYETIWNNNPDLWKSPWQDFLDRHCFSRCINMLLVLPTFYKEPFVREGGRNIGGERRSALEKRWRRSSLIGWSGVHVWLDICRRTRITVNSSSIVFYAFTEFNLYPLYLYGLAELKEILGLKNQRHPALLK